jgi:hypothetical protein
MKGMFLSALLSLDNARLVYFRNTSQMLLLINHEYFLVVIE